MKKYLLIPLILILTGACAGEGGVLSQNKAVFAGNPETPKPKPAQLEGGYDMTELPADLAQASGIEASYLGLTCPRDAAQAAKVRMEDDFIVLEHFLSIEGYFTKIRVPYENFVNSRRGQEISVVEDGRELSCLAYLKEYSGKLYVTLACTNPFENTDCHVTLSKDLSRDELTQLQGSDQPDRETSPQLSAPVER